MPDSLDPRASSIFEGIGRDELIGEHPSLVLEVGPPVGAGSRRLALGTPPHTLLLASSPEIDVYQHVVEQINTSNSARPGGSRRTRSSAPTWSSSSIRTEARGLSSSAIAWCGSLAYNNYTNNVSRITENVLRRFVSNGHSPQPNNGLDAVRIPSVTGPTSSR